MKVRKTQMRIKKKHTIIPKSNQRETLCHCAIEHSTAHMKWKEQKKKKIKSGDLPYKYNYLYQLYVSGFSYDFYHINRQTHYPILSIHPSWILFAYTPTTINEVKNRMKIKSK